MTGGNILILVAVLVGMDCFIIPLIVGAVVDSNWNPMAEKYRPVLSKPGAVRRDFQSFAVGSLSLSRSIHVAADESYLHLSPCWLARRIRVRPASIPWAKIERVRTSGRSGSVRLVELPSIRLQGPRWCLELASPQPT